jgi:hypothetical protein
MTDGADRDNRSDSSSRMSATRSTRAALSMADTTLPGRATYDDYTIALDGLWLQ